MILISEGLVFEGLGGETDELAGLAADSRASLDVLLLDVPRFDASHSTRPTTPREDRESADRPGSRCSPARRAASCIASTPRPISPSTGSRARSTAITCWASSRVPEDRNGRRHRIGVKSLRRGVTIRSRRSFLTSMSAKATTPADAVSRAIRSPLPINDLPLKVSTWIYKQPGGNKVRVLIAAEVERLAGQSLDYTVGMAIVNKQGRGYAPPIELKQLIAESRRRRHGGVLGNAGRRSGRSIA